MKKISTFVLLFIAMLVSTASASLYYPVTGGSIIPYSGEYVIAYDNWAPATFFDTTMPTVKPGGTIPFRGLDPDFWNEACKMSWMPFLSAMARTWEGVMPVFTDYILGNDWVFSFETHPVEQRPAPTPIPPSALLLGTGLTGLGLMRRRVRG